MNEIPPQRPEPDEGAFDQLVDKGLRYGFSKDQADPEIDRAITTRASRVRLRDPEGAPERVDVDRTIEQDAPGAGRDAVGDEIARGGVGQVVRGRDRDLGRDVALKILLERHMEYAPLVERFVREARISGQLQHPGVVPVYDVGLRPDRRPFFAMKLVRGKTLAELLDARKSPAEDRRRFLAVFEKILDTMAYAHACGVIHRDLKPSNVMVGAFGEVQVMDWGLSKVLDAGAEETPPDESRSEVSAENAIGSPGTCSSAGSVMGTFSYMPTEQARGKVNEVDERSDVFALGAMLCEILTGAPPYQGGTVTAIRSQAMRGHLEPAFSRLARSGADPELVRISRQCLSPARDARPASAGKVAERLRGYLAGVDARARKAEIEATEARVKAQEERKARRLTVVAAAAVVMLIVVAGGGYLWIDAGRRERVARTVRAVNAAMDEAFRLQGEARVGGEKAHSKWLSAIAAAEKASAIVEGRSVNSEVVLRVEELNTEVRAEMLQSQVEAAQLTADRVMSRRLEEVPLLGAPDDPGVVNVQDAEYFEAFRAYGIDLDKIAAAEAASLINASSIVDTLWSAVDDWSVRLKNVDHPRYVFLKRLSESRPLDHVLSRLSDAAKRGDAVLYRRFLEEAVIEDRLAISGGSVVLGQLSGAREAMDFLDGMLMRWPDQINVHTGIVSNTPVIYESSFADVLESSTMAILALRPDSAIAWLLASRMFEERSNRRDKVGDKERSRACDVLRERCLLKSLTIRPTSTAQSLYASLLRERHELEKAQLHAKQAIEMNPNNAHAYMALGVIHRDRGDRSKALEEFQKASKLIPKNSIPHSLAGETYAEIGDWKKSAGEYSRAVELKPTAVLPRLALAHALRKCGRIKEALREYGEVLRIDPACREANIKIVGLMALQGGDLEEALKRARVAFRYCPNNYDVVCNLGAILLKKKRLDEAVLFLKCAVSIDGARYEARFNIATALEQLAMPRRAVFHLEKITEKGVFKKKALIGDALYRLSKLYRCIGNVTASEVAGRRAIQVISRSGRAYSSLSETLYILHDFEDAQQMAREAIRLAPGLSRAYLVLSKCCLLSGEYDKAQAAAKRVLELRPSSFEGTVAIAQVQELMRDHDAVIRTIRPFSEKEGPEKLTVNYILGDALRARGKIKEALRAYESAIDSLESGTRAVFRDGRKSRDIVDRIRQCERMLLLQPTVSRVLDGETDLPESREACAALASLTYFRGSLGAAAGLWCAVVDRYGFENLSADEIYRMLNSLIGAGCGQGNDKDRFSPEDRRKWRGEAMSLSVALLEKRMEEIENGDRDLVSNRLFSLTGYGKYDPNFRWIREDAELAKLPEVEKTAWREYWKKVDEAIDLAWDRLRRR